MSDAVRRAQRFATWSTKVRKRRAASHAPATIRSVIRISCELEPAGRLRTQSDMASGRVSARAALHQEVEELHARFLPRSEAAEHRARDRARVLLLHAAHQHAHVLRLDDDTDAERGDLVVDRLGDLRGEPLLHLQPPAEDLDHSGDLAQPDDLLVREIRDVALAEEWEDVMLAQGE